VGLFGGTFDPPHKAHVQLAHFAVEHLHLYCLYFIPAALHALKKNTNTPVALRYKMIQAAISDNPKFKISRIEMERPDVSYSIDTLRQFKKYEHLPDRTELYYIMGLDNLNELHLWKDPQQIFQLARVVILNRPGFNTQQLAGEYPQALILNSPLYPVSATDIRRKIRSGEAVHDVLPPGVWKIINENNLYHT
jgi:nicotinate-nucleotide adenylyltransferase